MIRKFNAKIGRKVTYNSYPQKKFVIERINPDGTLDLAIGDWKILNVTIDRVCR
jgi:hypothetical protein